MQRSIRLLPALFTAALWVLTSGPASASSLSLQQSSALWLEGKSTIHDYHSKATRMDAKLEEDAATWPAGATGAAAIQSFVRAKGVRGMQFVVPVRDLKSGKDGLDRNLYKALKYDKYPDIRYTMIGYEVGTSSAADTTSIVLKGTLNVAGVDREVRLPIQAVRDGDVLRLTGSTPLLMSQFGVKPPTMMMGTLRVADEVVIHFDLRLGFGQPTGTAKVD
jgi:polyisoprenoid-binding protein YceI